MALKGYFGPRTPTGKAGRAARRAAAEQAAEATSGVHDPLAVRLQVMDDGKPTLLPAFRDMDQDTLRHWRRRGYQMVYDSRFVLSDELKALTLPHGRDLKEHVRAVPEDLTLTTRAVSAFAEALQEALHPVGGWLAGRVAVSATAHVADPAARSRSAQLVRDLAQRPTVPAIEPSNVESGRWPLMVAKMAEMFDAPLAELLRSGRVPGEPAHVTASDALSAVLAELDRAEKGFVRKYWSAVAGRERAREYEAMQAAKKPRATEDLRAELRSMGVEV